MPWGSRVARFELPKQTRPRIFGPPRNARNNLARSTVPQNSLTRRVGLAEALAVRHAKQDGSVRVTLCPRAPQPFVGPRFGLLETHHKPRLAGYALGGPQSRSSLSAV